jgi:hypothetical protein
VLFDQENVRSNGRRASALTPFGEGERRRYEATALTALQQKSRRAMTGIDAGLRFWLRR